MFDNPIDEEVSSFIHYTENVWQSWTTFHLECQVICIADVLLVLLL